MVPDTGTHFLWRVGAIYEYEYLNSMATRRYKRGGADRVDGLHERKDEYVDWLHRVSFLSYEYLVICRAGGCRLQFSCATPSTHCPREFEARVTRSEYSV